MLKRLLLSLLVIVLAASTAFSQIEVSGKVIDSSNGEGVPGVSILVKGTTTGTASDVEGNYRIEIQQDNPILIFSAVGFASQEIIVGNKSVIDIALEVDIQALDEVVVIGYGTQEKKYLTGTVASVGAEEISRTPVTTVDQALQGRASGVQVTQSQGVPGAPVTVRIRGVGTFGNSDPLFVVDGIPLANDGPGFRTENPLNSINPSDIESIEVLKDASTAAIYGVRAANGVILITTKKGSKGKLRVNFDMYAGIQQWHTKYDWLDTPGYQALATEIASSNPDAVLPFDLEPGSEWLQFNTDWQEEFINSSAPIQNYQVSLSGGSETSTYYFSAGYFDQQATVIGTDLKRFSMKLNSEHKFWDRVKVGQNLLVSTTATTQNRFVNGFNGNGSIVQQSDAPPNIRVIDDPNDNIPGFRGYSTVPQRAGASNPIAVDAQQDNGARSNRILGNVYAEVEIINGLKLRGNVGIDHLDRTSKGWEAGWSEVIWAGVDRPQNSYQVGDAKSTSLLLESTLNYNRIIGDHSFDILAGVTQQEFWNEGLTVQSTDFISTDPNFYRFLNSGSLTPGRGTFGESALLGYIGRVNYAYKDRYLLNFTVRRDGTSRFNPEDNRRWGTFPSVSAGWRISEEDFMSGSSFFSDLKLRGSWGQLGNQETAAYAYIFQISTSPDYALGTGVDQMPAVGPSPANFANQDLGWETVTTTDIGFDSRFLDDRLTFNFTWYRRLTSDILLNVGIPATSGLTNNNSNGPGSAQINAAEVENTGIEIDLGYRQVFNNGFELDILGNITTVNNEVLSLTSGQEQLSINNVEGGTFRTAVGQPIGYFYGYQTGGIFQNAGEVGDALPDNLSNDRAPGDIRFVDNNGPGTDGEQFSGQPDGIIDPNDRAFLGKTIPDFFYGVTVNAYFKGFDFSMFWQGVEGVSVMNQIRQLSESMSSPNNNQLATTNSRWSGEGSSNSMPRAVFGDPNQNNRFSDRWVESGDFLRLKNLQIGYNFADLVKDNKFLSNLRVYVSANNLLTFTDYSGLDPEIISSKTLTDNPGGPGTSLSAGVDAGNIPQPRTFLLGVQFGL